MGAVTWEEAAAELRGALLDDGLLRAVASGRPDPGIHRAVVRPVVVKRGPALQIVFEDGVRPTTRTLALGEEAVTGVDELLGDGFRNWHVETAGRTVKVQTSKKGKVLLSVGGPVAAPATVAGHDRAKEHLIDPGDPLFDVIGGDARKRRQVDAFLRALDATLPAELPSPLRVVDLGCGNAYLTFAAYRYLSDRVPEIHLTGVDVREDQRDRNSALARQLGFTGLEFVAGTILDATVPGGADLVLALHACDTATDEALARAVGWDAHWILAAPCCHKDLSRQLRASGRTSALTRSGILRERFADVLTDAYRSAILRGRGYAVDVVEFVDSAHTPRNLLLKAVRTGKSDDADLAALSAEWPVTPHLAELLR
ncbi:class I SAM-dependent methyltransferase [Hamadaea tsunoensis]|uniref:class I SAM-dependent methyltransferase n=1 Tax=Hamadaea tsunoensis TaxID=53368 RepID=UPI000409C32B|nr:SAM-dependent methyltransferase [Hamadaea tsunoensis]